MTAAVFRGIGHPWTQSPGWDQMAIEADTPEMLQAMLKTAKEKFWRIWVQNVAGRRAILYKPSGATAPWEDEKWQGTPRGHAHDWKVGDHVYTDFSGEITQHEIVEISQSKLSLCGIRFRVKPPVPGSEFVSDDPGKPSKVYGSTFIDASWFRKVI